MISNQVLRQLDENNTPYAKRKRDDFILKIDHSDAYSPNVERNNTFIHLESVLGELFKHQHSNRSQPEYSFFRHHPCRTGVPAVICDVPL